MITCWHCAKIIKGKMVKTVPSNLAIQLGTDFPKSYHPKCYEKAEAEAAKELFK